MIVRRSNYQNDENDSNYAKGLNATTTTITTTTAIAANAATATTTSTTSTTYNNNNNNNNIYNSRVVVDDDAAAAAAVCDQFTDLNGGAGLMKNTLDLVNFCLVQHRCSSQDATVNRHVLHTVVDAILASLTQFSLLEENRDNIRAEVDRLVAWILLQLLRVPRFMQPGHQQLPRQISEVTSTTLQIDDKSFRDSLKQALLLLLNCLLIQQKRLVVKHTVRPFPPASSKSSNAGYIVRVGNTKRFFPYTSTTAPTTLFQPMRP